MIHAAFLIPALPLAGFLVLAAFGRRLGNPLAGWCATAVIGASFLVTALVFGSLGVMASGSRHVDESWFTWFSAGRLHVSVGILVDPLSITMATFVTGVSALIHLYSIGYMRHDEQFHKFFTYMNLFVFSMLMLVLADNFLVSFFGWEGVGVCSYFLIAFWFDRPAAASAGKKAMIYNRIGDAGFLVAMFLIIARTGSLQYSAVFSQIGHLSKADLIAIALLLFLGAAGKSAQIPLFPWLADAMEGPTPISALIHAATMVTAGVYLMCRISPILHLVPDAAHVVAWVGVATAFVAATIGCAQTDIKKVLAYSTVSQLGYMFLAAGTGGYVAAIFLMLTHAFYKALLFLAAGAVIHGLDDEQNIKVMGALRKLMPLTATAFIVGWLSIAGVPPFSGFWSKGEVLVNAWAVSPALYVIGAATAFLTAYYMGREYFLVFGGTARFEAARPGAHPHDPEQTMLIPLVVLGFCSIFGGFISLPFHPDFVFLERWLEPVVGASAAVTHFGVGTLWAFALVDAALAVAGAFVAVNLWRSAVDRPALEPRFAQMAWYVDWAYDRFVARPGTAFASVMASVVEARVIDGAVNGVAVAIRNTGDRLRTVETGFVRTYALTLLAGAVAIVAYVLVRAALSAHLLAAAAAESAAEGAFPYLTTLVLVPVAGAFAVLAVPRSRRNTIRTLGLGVSLGVAGIAVAMLAVFRSGVGGYQMVSSHPWLSALGVSWSLGVDGISLFLVLLSALLFPLAFAGAGEAENVKSFTVWMLLLEAGCIGSFLALDLLVFFLFFEATLFPVYFLIGGWGSGRRGYSAAKFFIYTLAGSAFLLVGMVVLVFVHQGQTGLTTFDIRALASTRLSGAEGVVLVLAFTAAFAVKAPVFPFHTWSPDAYRDAPAAGSVILAGIMAKLGTYGIVRFDLTLFPHAVVVVAPVLLTLGVIGILYGAIVAAVERELKRLVAYSSLAHMGFIVVGLFALSAEAVSGAVLQMVNHGLITAALFLLIAMIRRRRQTTSIEHLSGLQHSAPIFAGLFTVVMLASIGVPGLNGFVGEFLILAGTFLTHRWWAVLAAVGVILAAVYFLWAYQQVFHGREDPRERRFAEISWSEGLVLAPLVAAIVFLGVYPKPVLDRINPSVNALVVHVENAGGAKIPTVGQPLAAPQATGAR